MADATYIACPRCGEPYAMTPMQKRLYHGRTLACQRCAKPFTVTEQTPEPVPAPTARAWVEREGQPSGLAASPPAPSALPGPTPKPARGMTPGRMALMIAGVLVVVSLVMYVAFAPSVHRARETGRRATCASNLQQLGMALQVHANGAGGRFPDSLDALVLGGTVTADLLVCPSSGDTEAPGATFPEQAASLAKGGHQSYVYLGRGLTLTAARQPLAYEALPHHDGAGVHVLYSDGSVQFLPKTAAAVAVPQLAAPATQPATPPATQPATPPVTQAAAGAGR